jgi:protein arginine kinase
LNFGATEKELIDRFTSGINDLIKLNNQLLIEFVSRNKDEFVDKIFRSYGLLRYSNMMDYNEALYHLSNLRIGLILNEKLDISLEVLNDLFIKIKEGYVERFSIKNKIEDGKTAISRIIKCSLEK